jgi:hypothetical protein
MPIAVRLFQQEGHVAMSVPRTALGPTAHAAQEEPLDAVVPAGAAALEVLTRVGETGTGRRTLVGTPLRFWPMHDGGTTTSPSRAGRAGVWWLVPCVQTMAR